MHNSINLLVSSASHHPQADYYLSLIMETPSSLQPSALCTILPLLSKVLELILLAVPDAVTPPAMLRKDGGTDLRWVREFEHDARTDIESLSIRLVSRHFHACSWKAFARLIEDTIFDLWSGDSVEHMGAALSCKQLRPWITKLTISSNEGLQWCTPIIKPAIDSHYGSEFRNEYNRIHEEQSLPGLNDVDLSQLLTDGPATSLHTTDWGRSLVTCIVQCWKKLPNIQEVSYLSGRKVLPARYKRLLRKHGYASQVETHGNPRFTNHSTSFAVCFMALNSAGIYPRVLDFTVRLNSVGAFELRSQSLASRVSGACSHVEHFTLRQDIIVPDNPALHTLPSMEINATMFPRLRSLTIDLGPFAHYGFSISGDASHQPRPPKLKHNSLLDYHPGKLSGQGYLGHFSRDIDSLTVTVPASYFEDEEDRRPYLTLGSMLELIANLGVGQLDIYLATDDFWQKTILAEWELNITTRN